MSSIPRLLEALARERDAHVCKKDFIPNLLRVVAEEIEGYKMPVIYSNAVHASRMAVVRDSIDAAGSAGSLHIFTDNYTTRLASITLGYPGTSTATISVDSMTFAGFPREDISVDASGVAALARIVDGNGVTCVSGMTVGTQDADIVIARTALVAGETFRINSAKLGNVPALPPANTPQLPVIISVTPISGAVGAPISITGTSFGSTAGTVRFGTVVASVTSWSDTAIVCTAPAGTAVVSIVVTSAVGASNAATFTYTTTPAPTLPTIISVVPAAGIVGSGVTITGTNFGATKGTSVVRFGTVTATTTSWSNTSISAAVPAGTATVQVTVTTPAGTTNAASFLYQAVPPPPALPAIALIVPSTGVAGISVTLTGTDFGATTGTVKFGTVNAAVTSWTDTVIACTVPAGTNSVSVTVTNAIGVSNARNFTYTIEVPPIGERELGSYSVWPNLEVSNGTSAIEFNRGVALRWKNLNGDWLDANQLPQGPTPWYTLNFPKNTIGYVEFSITSLVQRWQQGENRGAFFLIDSSNNVAAFVVICGTYGLNPPQLVIARSGYDPVTITGDLCGFTPASSTATSPPTMVKCAFEAKASRQQRQVIHFRGVEDLAGTITSATLRLHADSSDDIYALNIKVFETDAPPLLMGGAGLPPVYGLAAEVGEENLPGHPDVLFAGDFREENWSNNPGAIRNGSRMAKPSNPGALFNSVSMNVDQYLKSSVVEDLPDSPGRYYLRTCVAQGNIGGGEFHHMWHRSGPPETGRMPLPEDYEGEIYHRCEIWLESDSFWSNNYGFKFSPVGMNINYGKGEDNGEWNESANWHFGSGQTPSDGKRHWRESSQQWILQGHSIRGHTLGFPHPTYTAYPKTIAVGFAPSHLGPYNHLYDGSRFGTEQALRIGTPGRDHCIPMDRWVTIESHMRINTVDMSVLDAEGNGVARNDGIYETWIDGVYVGGRYNMAWVCHPAMGISGTWTMVYHGGGTNADHDIFWRIRNHCVARRYIGPKA